jgi:hypothetical protein
MKEAIGISEELLKNIKTEKGEGQKTISFSQYSVYESCPYRWYQTYAKGNYLFSASINTVFGTAIHEAIQTYLTLLFNDSVKAADQFDVLGLFEKRFKEEYIKEVENNGGAHFSSKEEMAEFYQDGVEIINYFRKKRLAYFSTRDYELLGMEIPLLTKLKEDSDVFLFQGYVDFIYRDKTEGTVYIEDFKTSTKGWRDYEKKDEIKQAQILLYKNYFSKQFGVEPDKIVPRFRILKRKLYENADFPQSRIQIHEPANGKNKVHQAVQKLTNFINECFNQDGTPKEQVYLKKSSGNNCRFCPFKDREDICDKKNTF